MATSFWRGRQTGRATASLRLRRFYLIYFWSEAHLQVSLRRPVWFIHIWRLRFVIGTDGPHWKMDYRADS